MAAADGRVPVRVTVSGMWGRNATRNEGAGSEARGSEFEKHRPHFADDGRDAEIVLMNRTCTPTYTFETEGTDQNDGALFCAPQTCSSEEMYQNGGTLCLAPPTCSSSIGDDLFSWFIPSCMRLRDPAEEVG